MGGSAVGYSVVITNMKAQMGTARGRFIHTINPLHIYCRLRGIGLNKYTAKFISCLYENLIFNLIKNND